MENFKVGEVVKLKSGSPEMTISALDSTSAHVAWFAENKIHRDKVNINLLKKV